MVKISLDERLGIAEKFLSYFPGFQIFVSKFDPPKFEGYKVDEVDKKPWHYHGDLEDYQERLIHSNTPVASRGIFFTVNNLDHALDKDRKRTNKMWVNSRAIWCEDDNPRDKDHEFDYRDEWPIVPNLIVNSSPGKYHYYWLTNTDNQLEWAGVQARMVEDYGSDKSVKDLARVLRLPGFYHLKDPENPHLVKYICLRTDPYTWDEIKEAFPPMEVSENPAQVSNPEVENAKRERIFIRTDPTLDILLEKKMVKGRMEKGVWDITCPWVKEHTNKEDSGTRYFQAYFNGYDQSNFKCNHTHCQGRTIQDLREKIGLRVRLGLPEKERKDIEVRTLIKPKFPNDFMLDWPEPWPMIWENWKRLPRELSQPLLTPTVISLHAYILNSKYITDWGRRPNLYQLNLAESTANKDTNSKDVLRSLSEIMIQMGILNSIFNINLFNSDSNITSDTAFLKALEVGGGNLFWMNTEATRVFQQLNSAGGGNSSVMALSDKMIEVVDGHGITAKMKANEKLQACSDPNIQIVFYAQPETIERFISEDMIDSGFLGRAIITLDDRQVTDSKPNMFIRRKTTNKNIDKRLAQFYASRTIGTPIKQVYVAAPDERGMFQLSDWSEYFIHPMLDSANGQHSAMYKMISRIGNTAEQLYAVILGICREWDEFNQTRIRGPQDISPMCMFPILEFWAKSKQYVVQEFISVESDPIAKALEQVLLKYINEEIKIDADYKEILESRGMIPRSVLIRSMRSQKRLQRKLSVNNDIFMSRVNQVLDSLIQNEIMREEILAKRERLLRGKKTKFIGFL